jgi:hypothetical protein
LVAAAASSGLARHERNIVRRLVPRNWGLLRIVNLRNRRPEGPVARDQVQLECDVKILFLGRGHL